MKSQPKKKQMTIDELAGEMRQGFKELRTDMESGFREVRRDIKDIRSDIKNIHSDLAMHDRKMDELAEKFNEVKIR
jgi:hypothetical protein